MSERVDLCNRALQRIGSEAIQTDDGNGADDVLAVYDDVLAVCLAHKHWSFSVRTQQLDRLSGEAPGGFYDFAFKLPADRLGLPLAVFDQKRGNPFTEFEYGEGLLLTNAETIFARYQYIPPISNWPPLFRECVILATAAVLAKSGNEDDDTYDTFWRKVFGDPREPGRMGLIGKAGHADASAKPSTVLMQGSSSLISVRSS